MGFLFATMVIVIFAFVFIREFGFYLPMQLQGIVRYITHMNPFVFLVVLAIIVTVISLVLQFIRWALSYARRVSTPQGHMYAIGLFAINFVIMPLAAAYPGYYLVGFFSNLINFTRIPQHYCVLIALFGALIVGFVDYCAASHPECWGRLIVAHAIYGVLLSFMWYLIAVAIIITVLTPLFKLNERFGKTAERVSDSLPSWLSPSANIEITKDIMGSSLGFWLMFLPDENDTR